MNSYEIPTPSYFTGKIGKISGLFCKVHDSRIILIDEKNPLSWTEDSVEVSNYRKCSVEFRDIPRPTEVLVKNIPVGTVFTGCHGYGQARFLKLADGGLATLEEAVEGKILRCWGAYCGGNVIVDYVPIDVDIEVNHD